MDFIKELIELNNIITLEGIAKERNLNEEETICFVYKYNKRNNRQFALCKKYMIDDYQKRTLTS